MATIEIKHRWTGAVLLTCELTAEVGRQHARRIRALMSAITTKANISCARRLAEGNGSTA